MSQSRSTSSSIGRPWTKRSRRPAAAADAATKTATRAAFFMVLALALGALVRTYRDRKEIALLAAQFLKSRNPNSVVKVKDLKTGEEIVIAFKSGQ